MTGKISEKLLLFKLRTKQDPDAFAELYDLYVERIYRFVFFKVSGHEEAEDVTSDVFLKIWRHINEGKEIKSFSGLLYKIARNSIIDLYRRKVRSEMPLPLSELTGAREPSDEGKWQTRAETEFSEQEILQDIKKLKQEYQEVLTLRYVDGLAVNEIAQIMEKKSTTVRVILHRAIKKLGLIIKEKK